MQFATILEQCYWKHSVKNHVSKCWGYYALCHKTSYNSEVPILDCESTVAAVVLISIGKNVWDNVSINQVRKHQR